MKDNMYLYATFSEARAFISF